MKNTNLRRNPRTDIISTLDKRNVDFTNNSSTAGGQQNYESVPVYVDCQSLDDENDFRIESDSHVSQKKGPQINNPEKRQKVDLKKTDDMDNVVSAFHLDVEDIEIDCDDEMSETNGDVQLMPHPRTVPGGFQVSTRVDLSREVPSWTPNINPGPNWQCSAIKLPRPDATRSAAPNLVSPSPGSLPARVTSANCRTNHNVSMYQQSHPPTPSGSWTANIIQNELSKFERKNCEDVNSSTKSVVRAKSRNQITGSSRPMSGSEPSTSGWNLPPSERSQLRDCNVVENPLKITSNNSIDRVQQQSKNDTAKPLYQTSNPKLVGQKKKSIFSENSLRSAGKSSMSHHHASRNVTSWTMDSLEGEEEGMKCTPGNMSIIFKRPDVVSSRMAANKDKSQIEAGGGVSEARFADDFDEDETLLCVFYSGGKLGAATFNTLTGKLALLKDIPDAKPDFDVLTSLIQQVDPNYILTSARHDEEFRNYLESYCSGRQTGGSRSTINQDTLQEQAFSDIRLVYRPGAEYSVPNCTQRFKNINLVPASRTDQWQKIRVSAYLDLHSENMVRCAGALLKYLDSNFAKSGLNMDDSDSAVVTGCRIHGVEEIFLDKVLNLSGSVLCDLQIFSPQQQQSGSRAGAWNKEREGFSLFTLLNRCHSVIGSRYLRRMLRAPSTDLQVIKERQAAIKFLTSSQHKETNLTLIKGLGRIKNMNRLIRKLDSNHMKVVDWQNLYKSIGGMILISRTVSSLQQHNVPIFIQISENINDDITALHSLMNQVIDFEAERTHVDRVTVKSGVDEELDRMRGVHNSLPDFLTNVAQQECRMLPGEVADVCTVSYIPQVGFLLVIPVTDRENKIQLPGYDFVFESNKALHYKSDKMKELDQAFGDIAIDILEREVSIMLKLSEAILAHLSRIEAGMNQICELDCLLAMSLVSLENNWKRPRISQDGPLEIVDGRHPLQELAVSPFIPNNTNMDLKNGRIHMISGPNASGKSIYMKQVALIVYLGHLGCWVPARSANIPILDKIFTRIHTVESVSIGISSFLCDVNQVSRALRNGGKRSLLLIDEFGKGTAAVDGTALFLGLLSSLMAKKEECPLAILSSHFHQGPRIIPESGVLRYMKMETQEHDGDLIFLYKIVAGSVQSSGALNILNKVELPHRIKDRSQTVLKSAREGKGVEMNEVLVDLATIHSNIEEFLDLLDYDQPLPSAYQPIGFELGQPPTRTILNFIKKLDTANRI